MLRLVVQQDVTISSYLCDWEGNKQEHFLPGQAPVCRSFAGQKGPSWFAAALWAMLCWLPPARLGQEPRRAMRGHQEPCPWARVAPPEVEQGRLTGAGERK